MSLRLLIPGSPARDAHESSGTHKRYGRYTRGEVKRARGLDHGRVDSAAVEPKRSVSTTHMESQTGGGAT